MQSDKDEDNKALFKKATNAFRQSDGAGALYLFKMLAKRGDTDAYCEIGNIYELGVDGVEKDYDQAFHWYKKSVDIGDDPVGVYCLGRLYYLGKGVEQDYSKAFWYYKLAADSGITPALLMLGRIYNLGLGVEKDVNEARRYFQDAANEGYVYAIKNLGGLEMSQGNVMKGVIIYIKGIWAHLKIYLHNKHDPRLRSA